MKTKPLLVAGAALLPVVAALLLILTEDGVSTGAELLWESEVFGTGVKVEG